MTEKQADTENQNNGPTGKIKTIMNEKEAFRLKLSSFLLKSFLGLVTCISAVGVVSILISIAAEAMPFFREYGLFCFFESDEWYPTDDPKQFHALGIFVGSGLVVLGSSIFAVPTGVLAAICLSDIVPFNVRQIVKPVIELLAAIPSVVFGFFALIIFAPILQNYGGRLLAWALWILSLPIAMIFSLVFSDLSTSFLRQEGARKTARVCVFLFLSLISLMVLYLAGTRIYAIDISSGVNILNASVILAFMALPTVVSVCEDALTAVGRNLREGSYALGATRAETIIKVVVPAAKGGIIAAIILGVMRAVGETMVVLMAAGNAIEVPSPWYNLFDNARTLTATIAMEMGETPHGGAHYSALFALGFVLLIITFVMNLISEWVVRFSRIKQK